MNQKFVNLIDQARKDFQAPVFMSRLRGKIVSVPQKKVERRWFGAGKNRLASMQSRYIISLTASVGVMVVVVAVVFGWDPFISKLGFKNNLMSSYAYAQEMLRLTREQINALSVEERVELAKHVQGNLEEAWKEAEVSKDLRFLKHGEFDAVYINELNQFLKHKMTSETIALSPKFREQGFRYTDPQGKVTYIIIETYHEDINSAESNLLISKSTTWLNVVKFDYSPADSKLYAPLTLEQRETLKKKFAEKIEVKFPELWPDIQADRHAIWQIIEPNLEDGTNWWAGRIVEYFDINRHMRSGQQDILDEIRTDDPYQVVISADNQYGLQPKLVLTFKDQQGKKYWIDTSINPMSLDKLSAPLVVLTLKKGIK